MELKKLNLSIPSMDSDDCKSLMGGDGYNDIINLEDLVVIGHSNERPDDELDPREDDNNDHDTDEDDYRNDSDRDNSDSSDGTEGQSNSQIPEQVLGLYNSLPKAVQQFLSSHGINIKLGGISEDDNPGKYTGDSIILFQDSNGQYQFMALLHETIHAIQDSLGILDGKSLSAEEFQAHALLDAYQVIFSLIEGLGVSTTLDSGFNGEGSSGWNEFLHQCIIEDGDSYSFDRDYFINHVMDYFDLFQQSHQNSGHGYTDPLENNYNWSWEEFLDMLGL